MSRYSIRYVKEDAGPCSSCDDCEEIGRGPIGFHGQRPVCDWCLLMGDRDLGGLLVMAHLTREVDRLRGLMSDQDRALEALSVFTSWARYYSGDADGKWPPRIQALAGRVQFADPGKSH